MSARWWCLKWNSTTLDEPARERLELLVPLLLGKPNLVEIRGSVADPKTLPTGDAAAAWDVTFNRCTSVMNYLIELGVPAQRLRLSQTGAREQLARLTNEGDLRSGSFPVEVFALSEYAADFVNTMTLKSRTRNSGDTSNEMVS